MKRSEPVELMNMCVLRRGSKVLVQDRTDPNWPGVAFPGGHVEKGESFTDSVIREVQEKTGLTISSPRLCGIKDWCEDGVRHVVLLYRAEQFTGTPGKYVPLKETVRSFKEILEGKYDDVPENLFLMAGSIDEVAERYEAQYGRRK